MSCHNSLGFLWDILIKDQRAESIHGKIPCRRRWSILWCSSPPQIFGRFYTVLSVTAPIFGRFYAVLPVTASKIGFLSVIGSPDHRAFSMYGREQTACVKIFRYRMLKSNNKRFFHGFNIFLQEFYIFNKKISYSLFHNSNPLSSVCTLSMENGR